MKFCEKPFSSKYSSTVSVDAAFPTTGPLALPNDRTAAKVVTVATIQHNSFFFISFLPKS